MNIRRVQDLDEFLGRKLECKVIELNRNRNNVVLSRRAVLEDERREVRQKILDDLQPGQVVEGVISNIVEFGAFVDLDGIDGLIHISELSWSHVNHPSEVLAIGEKVKVKVLDIDRDRQRISLGLKQTQADPWQSVIESYQVNDVVEGKVTKVVTFGAFVEIHAGVEGLVHISELAAHHVENPREVVNQGDVLAVRVIEIDADRRRLSLSLKRVADSDSVQHHLPEDVRAAIAEVSGPTGPAALAAAEAAGGRGQPEATDAVDDDAPSRRWTRPAAAERRRRPPRRTAPAEESDGGRPPPRWRRPPRSPRRPRRRGGPGGRRARGRSSPRPHRPRTRPCRWTPPRTATGTTTRRGLTRRGGAARRAPLPRAHRAASAPASPRRSPPSPPSARRRSRATRWSTPSTPTPRWSPRCATASATG